MTVDALDWPALLESFDGDRDFCLEIMGDVEAQFIQKIPELQELVNAGDLESAFNIAHSLKGGALNIRAHQLSKSMEALEQATRDGKAEESGDHLAEAMTAWKAVQECLSRIRSGS